MADSTESDNAPMLRITDPKTGQWSVLDWQHVPDIVKELGISSRFSLSRDQQWLALTGTNVTVWDLTAVQNYSQRAVSAGVVSSKAPMVNADSLLRVTLTTLSTLDRAVRR